MSSQKQGKVGSIGIGTCPCHNGSVNYTTVIADGAITVTSEGVETAIVTSMGIASCGHPTIATTGSSTVFHENQSAHRVGDLGQNCGPYTLVTGCDTINVG